MIDEKEFNKKIKRFPVRKKLGYNELAYARSNSARVYSFCPLCKKIVEVEKYQVDTETEDQIKLKGTVSCDCRNGIRYLNKDFLKEEEEKEVSVWFSILICGAVFLAANISMTAILELPDSRSIPWVEPVAVILFILMLAGLVGGIGSFFYPVELLFRREPGESPKKEYKDILERIDQMNRGYQMGKRRKQLSGENETKTTDGNNLIYGFKGSAIEDSENATAVAVGYVTASHWADSEPDSYDSPDSYVPDDYEPVLDPYDRQALYDEEVIDDWVIAGGGNPFDFDDRMDALSDPFGFSDGESWYD